MNKPIDYETDFYAWAQHNANLLRQKQFSELDIEHLVEELARVARVGCISEASYTCLLR